MKQLLTILMAVVAAFTATAQTRNLVTLSHDGQLTFFDDIKALEKAIEAAVDGDIIYLSEGKFATMSSNRLSVINKDIKIIGSGRDSHIVQDIFCEWSTASAVSLSSPFLEGIKIEKIEFNSGNIDNLLIKACYIDEINVNNNFNITFDRCHIREFSSSNADSDVRIVNSKIGLFSGNTVIVDNCNIGEVRSERSYFNNSIINDRPTAHAHEGTYENCLFGVSSQSNSSGDYNCYYREDTVLLDDLEPTNDVQQSTYLGKDGTTIGCYGGKGLPYTENPTMPTVDTANSSVEYDKEENKLNVSITVTPN